MPLCVRKLSVPLRKGLVAYIQQHLSKACTLQGQGKPAIVTLDYTAKQESDECTVLYCTGIQDLWLKYRTLRNRLTHKLGLAKHEYYTDLFTEINDCKPYWQLVQNAAGGRSAQPILEASEDRTAGLKHRTRMRRKFSTSISLPLGRSSPMNYHRSVKRIVSRHITRVTPTVMKIELTHHAISEGLENARQKKLVDKIESPQGY